MAVAGTVTREARLLAIMGSGETTPTMAKIHRQLFERLGPGDVPAVLLDTPYGFQTNAREISARAVSYFRESVHRQVEIASIVRPEAANAVAFETAFARVAEARWVFSGPGSPTYALRQWRPTVLPRLLGEKLLYGGCLVFSSAAALTLGRWAVPVYEIYKVGADPLWEDGLDLLSQLGLTVAVIPHFDNAEGGTHDTRYCYLGEERLRVMEGQLPPGGWVLGVDEHTACVFDLDAGTAAVSGLGVVTVRRNGQSVTVPSGKTLSIKDLLELDPSAPPGAVSRAAVPVVSGVSLVPGSSGSGPGSDAADGRPGDAYVAERGTDDHSPLLAEVRRLATAFDSALSSRDATSATAAVLDLEGTLHAWSADTFQSDEVDRARAELRRMILKLGQLAAPGLREPRDVLAPWVEPLLHERAEARHSRRFSDGDRIRDRLEALGIEVRDTPAGTEWDLRPNSGVAGGVNDGG
jgi:hypothetical protein